MTLPASFPISAAQINVELGRSPSAPFSMTGAAERALAGVPSGPVSMANFLGKSAATPPPAKESSFLQLSTGQVGSNVTYAGVNFGAAAATRIIVICVHWSEGANHTDLNSASIGGVAASIHRTNGHTGGLTGLGVAIISAAVPTGTSGNVTLSFSSTGTTFVSIATSRLVGFAGPVDFGLDTSGVTTAPLSAVVSVPANGAVIAAYTGSTNTAGTPVSWGNATERYDTSSSVRVSGTFDSGLAAQSRSVSASQGVIADSGNALIVSTWG